MKFGSLLLASTLFISTLFPSLSLAKDIVTSTPTTYILSEQLMRETGIETIYLPPKRYGIERLVNWFAGKGHELAKQAGEKATVAITLGAVWPQDPTFVYTRQGNIRMIEIDASQAISPRAQSVAVLKADEQALSKYVWMNPTNLIRMASIIGEDLKKIYPKHATKIEHNQQRLLTQIRQLINQQQEVLLEKNIEDVVLLSTALEDFASGHQLFVAARQFNPELEWTEADKQALKQQFEKDKSLWLLTDKRPSSSLLALVPKERIMEIDTLARLGQHNVNDENPLVRWQL
ncbi:metal ABC transporter solute-binding protein, Zn/Mn family [Vibrio azureus]|uniref:metal ABC transporter solute-binding protein, Zn/Mn family n=1 Tax=Vibrio azureus TaxID=512649 RepID=UPI003AB1B0DF